MLQKDFNLLNDILQTDKQLTQAFNNSNLLFFLKDDLLTELSLLDETLLLDNFIGFAVGDYVNVGQIFPNPYDKYTYLEVVEYDSKNDRVLVELKDHNE